VCTGFKKEEEKKGVHIGKNVLSSQKIKEFGAKIVFFP